MKRNHEPLNDGIQAAVNENRIIKQVSSVGIFGNLVLTAFKLFAGIYGQHGFCSRLDKRAFSGEGFSGKGPFECLFYCSFAVKVISVTVGLLNSRPFMG